MVIRTHHIIHSAAPKYVHLRKPAIRTRKPNSVVRQRHSSPKWKVHKSNRRRRRPKNSSAKNTFKILLDMAGQRHYIDRGVARKYHKIHRNQLQKLHTNGFNQYA